MAKVLFRSVRKGKRRALITELNSIARKELEKTLDDKVKPALVKSHNIVVKDWKHKPKFQTRKFIKPNGISVIIFPVGENAKIWVFVDKGTRPDYPITPKRTKFLRFRTGYQPKTLPSPARTVSGGGRTTGPEVFARRVIHPGIKARNFTETIAKDIEPSFKRVIESTFRKVSKLMEE